MATLSSGEGRTKETRRRRHIYERLVQNEHASHGDPDGALIFQSQTKTLLGCGRSVGMKLPASDLALRSKAALVLRHAGTNSGCPQSARQSNARREPFHQKHTVGEVILNLSRTPHKAAP